MRKSIEKFPISWIVQAASCPSWPAAAAAAGVHLVPAMTTWNASVDHCFDSWIDTESLVRFGFNSLTDSRAPLTDSRFGYFADMNRDLGPGYYLDTDM